MKGVDEDGAGPGAGRVGRALAVLETVAELGSSTARTIAEHTGIPLPTTYRLAQELIGAGYLVHLKEEKRIALGYRLHRLAVGLHEDLGIPTAVRDEIRSLHHDLGMAAYLAIHRGTEFVVVAVADSPAAPRLAPMGFGFHDSPHATAFGKVGLSFLDDAQRDAHLHSLRSHTPYTITDPDVLRSELVAVRRHGLAWEHQEFVLGSDCLAVAITADDGLLLGSVAVSALARSFEGRARHVEGRVRACAARAGRRYRWGAHHT